MTFFVLLAIWVLGCSLMMVSSRKLVYAALWMAGALVGVGGLFLSLNAQFLALIQILVYAGAIVTLILFAIMFAQRED